MAKLLKKDLEKVKYVSAAELFKNMDKYDSIIDKIAYATRALLTYDMSVDSQDYAFVELVQATRMKIAEASAKTNESSDKELPNYIVDKNAESEKEDLAAEMFLANPAGYLKGEAEKTVKEIDDDDINLPWQIKLKDTCEKIIPNMDEKFNQHVSDLDQHSAYLGVKTKMESALGGRKAVEDLYKAAQTKGFFARIFNTSSAQWTGMENAYEHFNNPNKDGFGNMENLGNAASNYLKHKFPEWNPGEEIPAEAYTKLNDQEMAKVNFSISVLNAVSEQTKTEATFHSLVEATKDRNIAYSDVAQEENEAAKAIDLDELEFQNGIKEEIEADDFSLFSNSEDLDNENEAVIDNEVEAKEAIAPNDPA